MKPRWEPPQRRRSEPMILFSVGPHTFAIGANSVEEVREPMGLTPINTFNSSSKVKFKFQRNGREYVVVDSSFYFRLLPSKVERILVLRGRPVAITTGPITRIADVECVWALPNVFQGEERRWYRGIAVVDGNVVPVVNPESFITDAGTSDVSILNMGART